MIEKDSKAMAVSWSPQLLDSPVAKAGRHEGEATGQLCGAPDMCLTFPQREFTLPRPLFEREEVLVCARGGAIGLVS